MTRFSADSYRERRASGESVDAAFWATFAEAYPALTPREALLDAYARTEEYDGTDPYERKKAQQRRWFRRKCKADPEFHARHKERVRARRQRG